MVELIVFLRVPNVEDDSDEDEEDEGTPGQTTDDAAAAAGDSTDAKADSDQPKPESNDQPLSFAPAQQAVATADAPVSGVATGQAAAPTGGVSLVLQQCSSGFLVTLEKKTR